MQEETTEKKGSVEPEESKEPRVPTPNTIHNKRTEDDTTHGQDEDVEMQASAAANSQRLVTDKNKPLGELVSLNHIMIDGSDQAQS